MSVFKPRLKPNPIAILGVILISWIVIVPIVNGIQLPLEKEARSIVSYTNIKNLSPYTDYLKFFLLLLFPPLVAAIGLTLKRDVWQSIFRVLLTLFTRKKWVFSLTIVLAIFWTIYVSFIVVADWGIPDWNSAVIDPFHEGEYLGLLPNFTQLDRPFLRTFFIHGFGLDALPSLVADRLASQNNTIALTRFFYCVENALACAAYFWLLWEIVSSVKLKAYKIQVFSIVLIIFCVLENFLYKTYGGRDLVFMMQLALVVRYFRVAIPPAIYSFKQTIFLSVLVGASLPLSFLHTYDRAAYFVPVYLVASALTFCFGKRNMRVWIGGSGLGIFLVLLLEIATLGIEQVLEVFAQVTYWSKYGKYIAFLPLTDIQLNYFSFLDWFGILVLSATIVYLVWDYSIYHPKRDFFTQHYLTLILLIASLTYMRILLDRSPGRGPFAAMVTAFLLVYLMLKSYQTYFEASIIQSTIAPTAKLFFVLFLIAAIAAEPGFNIFSYGGRVQEFYQSLGKPDSELVVPHYLEAWNTLQPEIDRQSCFYTLTSEGLWYYLFDKPSCSKINYLYYVRPPETQEAVIREIDERQPNIILFSNSMWSNAIDGVPILDSASRVYQYFLQQYQPYRIISDHWFWQRRSKKIAFDSVSSNTLGSADTLCYTPPDCRLTAQLEELEIDMGDTASLNGWTTLSPQGSPFDAVYLSYGQENQLVSAARINPDLRWTLTIPTMSLPEGDNIFRVWSYDRTQDKLVQIGSDLPVEMDD
ncbi:hypothetical protein IQ235_04450 [Oscillatoriales cyanobacterium LEGE 11467]|uniref:Uncharacterized protein n=1 Tax=Zarconia navalis LEGE 11467 TaxID=1828826 RepID=A0A928VTU7_9CYAN|nr:hypothetical protein [Zarconia navalis]MBE9040041.1 hypothetical protein [Zarconia navalis LEGE 11467]